MHLSEFLAEFGDLDAEAGATLTDLAERVMYLDRKGSLTVKVSLEKKGGRIMTQIHVNDSPPKDDPEAGLFFVYGASPVEVECRLRFRVARGDLAIGYVIHRPDEIRRASFERDVLGTITSGLSDAIQVVEALAPDVPATR